MLMNIVFLRVLEYYIGIIFLTTNRVGNIDEAFNSRIHISLYYPPLNHGQTLGIWRMNLDRLSQIEDERSQVTGERRLTIARDEILKFAEDLFIIDDMRWNGRQIRNAFLIASALARFDKHAEDTSDDTQTSVGYDIGVRHFETVANAGLGFDRYMQETRGKEDGDLALQDGIRADAIQTAYPQIQGNYRLATPEYQVPALYDDPCHVPRSQGPSTLAAGARFDHRKELSIQQGFVDTARLTPEPYLPGRSIPQDMMRGGVAEEASLPSFITMAATQHTSPLRARTPQPPIVPSLDQAYYPNPVPSRLSGGEWHGRELSQATGSRY